MYSFAMNIMGMYESLKKRILCLFPTFVANVLHVDDKTEQVLEIYRASKYRFSWPHAYTETMHVPLDGYYYVSVWNGSIGEYEHYFLHASHLAHALGLKTLGSWWGLTDFSISTMLRTFMLQHRHKECIFSVLINGVDVSNMFPGMCRTISLRNNVTAKALLLLHDVFKGTEKAKREDWDVTIVDFDLVETTRSGDEPLID